jgi:DNA-binding FrmR family transcriptional regulator
MKMPNAHCTPEMAARFKRLEGQVRGILDMLENGSECDDILIQISAADAALKGAAKVIFKEHFTHCILDAVKKGDENWAAEHLNSSLEQFLKMK